MRSAEELAGCSGLKPEEDPNTALFSIDVIQIPIAAPQNAKIVTGRASLRTRDRRDLGPGRVGPTAKGPEDERDQQCQTSRSSRKLDLAAGACSGNGILLDIRDPKNPVRLDHVSDTTLRTGTRLR